MSNNKLIPTKVNIESTLITLLNANSIIIANEIKNVINWKSLTKDSMIFIELIIDIIEIKIKPMYNKSNGWLKCFFKSSCLKDQGNTNKLIVFKILIKKYCEEALSNTLKDGM